MSAYQRNVIVGVVVLLGLGMLAWMVLQFAGKASSYFLSQGTKITLTASAAAGLSDGSSVTYKGVNVGRVTSVRRVINPKTNVEDVVIDALIQNDPPLPAHLHGKIKQTSLLGGSAMIELEPDPMASSRPLAAGDDGYIKAGANLPATAATDIASLSDDIRELSTSMQVTIASINKIVGDPKVQEDIKVSLSNARETLESANRVAAKLEMVGESIEKTSSGAQAAIGDVRVTVTDARNEIKKMSDNLNQRLQQLAESLQRVQSVAQKIDKGEGTAGKLVNDPKLYESLSDTASELNLMVKDMRRLIQQWEQEGIIKL